MANFEFEKHIDSAPADGEAKPLITEVAMYSTVAPAFFNGIPCTIRPPWQEHALPVQPENGAVPADKGNGNESPTCPSDPTSSPNVPNRPELNKQ